MNYIVYSKDEKFINGAQKIKFEAENQDKKCEVIELGRLSSATYSEQIKNTEGCVYFLTSNPAVPQVVEILNKARVQIINSKILFPARSKFELLQMASASGVSIPQHANVSSEMTELDYPVYLKSKNPIGSVELSENKEDLLKKILLLPDKDNYYLEEAIISTTMELGKFYYIKKFVMNTKTNEGTATPPWLQIVFEKISESLGAEIFSVDMFIDWSTNTYFCIDINLASAFFNSDAAREKFVAVALA